MSLPTNLHEDIVPDFHHGRTVIGASAAPIIAVNVSDAVKGVQLKAGPTNTGIIYVGKYWVTAGNAVATDGMFLSAGEGFFIPTKDLSRVYAIASAASQDLYWFVT